MTSDDRREQESGNFGSFCSREAIAARSYGMLDWEEKPL